jgi:hypothetical protein
MSNEQTPVEEVSLDQFSLELFGQNKAEPEPTSPDTEATEETDDVDALETEVQTQDDEDTVEPDEDTEVEAEAEKPKKKTAQERINEVIGKQREAERRLNDALAEIEALKKTEDKPKEQKPEKVSAPIPEPTDLNEDGTEKYPLGEFDPLYIADIARHAVREERAKMKAEEERLNQESKINQERQALTSTWTEKLGPAKERYPDFDEKGNELISEFSSLDQDYAEYLSAALMSLEFGPDVLYYLSNNRDEAKRIVNLSPTMAVAALGRIDGKFVDADLEKKAAKPKVSQAPVPPPQNKGSAVAAVIPPDTDDLDAFNKLFYKKKA